MVVKVADFYVDGVRKPWRTYGASDLPGTLTGAGTLLAGTPGLSIIFR